ncbi:hypothetical protein M413DRAFT_20987 [Hebeloma cylindrosporum]|uniref:Uncharacterized protein n=1 Tax=Hebeloma cylindrosporum TaxID=76867 RepID=A0A0C2YG08_HEBCY|nr:hypothetical protein M413DRAFT_20987 [Hebeloma cylindrosporum h7]
MSTIFFKGHGLSNKTSSIAKAAIVECLEDVNVDGLGDTSAHSNTGGAQGWVLIGVQASMPSVGGAWERNKEHEAEARDLDVNDLTCGVERKVCRCVSGGVDAGQQVEVSIRMGSFFQNGNNITVNGGSFKTVYGDFYELPEEVKRSVN